MNILNTTYNALLHGFIDTPFSLRNKRYHQDRIAMQIAARHGMTYEYKVARRHNLSPIDALEDWDLMKPEDYKLFFED